MSLLINIPNRNVDSLLAKLEQHIPTSEIQVWPNITSPESIKFALVWKHQPGSLSDLSNLKGISSFGAGVDSILSDSELPEVPIARIVDEDLALNMTNYVVTLINSHRLRLDMFAKQQTMAMWKPRGLRKGKTVGVLGLGQLGQAVCHALSNCGFTVTGWSNSIKEIPGVDSVTGLVGFDKVIAESDYLVCLLPLTASTKGIINRHVLHKMKTDAVLINVARGGHVVEQDLIEALYDKEIAAAYLDVFDIEPLPETHPYWRTPNLTITPHISAVTNINTAVDQVVANYNRVMSGQLMTNTIDKNRGY